MSKEGEDGKRVERRARDRGNRKRRGRKGRDADREGLSVAGDEVFFIFLSLCQPRASSVEGLSEDV